MERTQRYRGVLLITLALSLLPAAAAEVVVFDRYVTKATLEGDTIHIERAVRIKNVGSSPIIPGELHFRLYEQKGGDKEPLAVTNFEASSNRGEKLATKISERKDETDLSIQLWNPLLPSFFYDFSMEYDLDFEPSGVLFYEIKLPQEDTTIPIVNEETQFYLKKSYHVTYAPGSAVSKISGNTVVTWENTDDTRVVEYSRIPLPKTGIRAVNVFWIVIIIALMAVLATSIMKQKRKPSYRAAPHQYNSYYQQPPPQPPWHGGR